MESCFLGSQGWSPGLGVGGCLLGEHCLGRSLEERGTRVVLAPLSQGCPGVPVPQAAAVARGSKETEALTWWPRNG